MPNRKISQAAERQSLRDVLLGACTTNLNKKNVGSAQNSLIDPAMSTAGDYSVNGQIYTKAASSSVFVLTDTTVPAYGASVFVLTLDAAGSGVGRPCNINNAVHGVDAQGGNAVAMTSAQISSLVASPATSKATVAATVQAADDLLIWPAIPATECPVGLYTVVAGSVSHVSGSSSFSLVTSAGGSHLFTDILNLNQCT